MRSQRTIPKVTKAQEGIFGYVYILLSGKKCKIGISGNPEKRIRQIETAAGIEMCKYTIFGPVYGFRACEKHLHLRHDEHRITGEWFKKGKKVYKYSVKYLGKFETILKEYKKESDEDLIYGYKK